VCNRYDGKYGGTEAGVGGMRYNMKYTVTQYYRGSHSVNYVAWHYVS